MSIAGYLVKFKGNNKFKETFKFYIKSNNTKIILLTQLFRIFRRILEKPDNLPFEPLTEKEKEEERERQKKHGARVKALTTTFMDIFVNFIYENLENLTIRQYILENLGPFIKMKLVSFEQYFPEYLKAMLDFIGLNHSLNIFDMAFIMTIIESSNFDIKKAFGILDSLLNLFFLTIPQAKFLLLCMSSILRKIPTTEPVFLSLK